MQPTMKLRWHKEKSSFSEEPQVMNGYEERLVLQQWWEGFRPTSSTYANIAPSYISFDNKTFEKYGEWRDVPIESE